MAKMVSLDLSEIRAGTVESNVGGLWRRTPRRPFRQVGLNFLLGGWFYYGDFYNLGGQFSIPWWKNLISDALGENEYQSD